jgi:hypothetical protein
VLGGVRLAAVSSRSGRLGVGRVGGCALLGALVVDRAEHLAGRVASDPVLAVDEGRHAMAGLLVGGEPVQAEQLELEGGVERLRDRVGRSRQLHPMQRMALEACG